MKKLHKFINIYSIMDITHEIKRENQFDIFFNMQYIKYVL